MSETLHGLKGVRSRLGIRGKFFDKLFEPIFKVKYWMVFLKQRIKDFARLGRANVRETFKLLNEFVSVEIN